jgi:hypothetical protein
MTTFSTGMRGFLQWLKNDQPGIYAKLVPQLPKIAPGIFVTQKLGNLRALYQDAFKRREPQGFGALGCYFSIPCVGPICPGPLPTANICDLTTIDVGTICPGPAPTASYSCPTPSSSQISTGATTATTAAAVGSAVNQIAGAVLTATQAATLASIIQSQLSRAQNGEAPASVSSKTLGVPTVSTSGSMDDLFLLALVGVGAWVALS